MSSLLTVRMTRPNSGVVWGFRLYGGAEFRMPLVVPKIMTNSVAERAGLRVNDIVIAVNSCNAETMTHEQAKMEIIRTGNDLTFVVRRSDTDEPFQMPAPREMPNYPCKYVNPTPPQPEIPVNIVSRQRPEPPQKAPSPQPYTTSKIIQPTPKPFKAPSPQPNPEPKPVSQPTREPDTPSASQSEPEQAPQSAPEQKPEVDMKPLTVDVVKAQEAASTDPQEVLSPRDILATPEFQQPRKRFTPKGPGKKSAVPNLVHAQYNSPMGLYSAENIAAQYSAHSKGIQKEMERVDLQKTPVGTTMSGTFQVLPSK